MADHIKPIHDLWILLRVGSVSRRFLRIAISKADGSVYFSLGDPHRSVRIAQGTFTIPAGQTSASVDYTKHIVAKFENFLGEHLGLKASGRVIHKYGDRHHPLPVSVSPIAANDTLVQTIYPAPLNILPVKQARARDILLPDQFEYRMRPGKDMDSVFGADPFHVEIWQMAAGTNQGEAGPTVVGTCSIKAGERQFVFAFVQDDVDRQRGWLPGGTRILRPLPSQPRSPSQSLLKSAWNHLRSLVRAKR